MADVKFRLNGKELTAPEGTTILAAAQTAGVALDTLYYLKGLIEADESGVCLIKEENSGALLNPSAEAVSENAAYITEDAELTAAKKEALAKLFAIYSIDDPDYGKNPKNELEALYAKYEMAGTPTLPDEKKVAIDDANIAYTRDNNKCIKCKRCVFACGNIQNTGALGCKGEGLDAVIGPVNSPFIEEFAFGEQKCVNCGQCVAVCPAGALTPKDDTAKVKAALTDHDKFVVVQTAPAVRAAFGEEFGLPIGTDVEKKLPTALRALGFDKVFDTKFGADLTIVEEANELVERISNGGVLPMITSCCPGWVKFCEDNHPTLLPNVSSCKSPHTMEGAIIKSYFSRQTGIPKEDIVVVSMMPCTAKKFEITREDECGTGLPDVDIVITTREAADMLKAAGIDLSALEESEFDDPLGQGTGAGVIFGATGGVMEAAIRTAVDTLTGEDMEKLAYTEVRGMEGIKEASYKVGDTEMKVAVVSGLSNADELLKKVEKHKVNYHFIEVMACPGGCINGGGQPYQTASVKATVDVKAKRAEALYSNDVNSKLRKSHENPAIIKLYDEYLESYGSEKAHKLLHTTYKVR